MYHNSVLSTPLLLIASLAAKEPQRLSNFLYLNDPIFWMALLLCSSWAVILVFSITVAAGKVSPLATSVTGNLKDVFGMGFGMLIWTNADRSPKVVTGLLVSVFASGVYSVLKLRESH